MCNERHGEKRSNAKMIRYVGASERDAFKLFQDSYTQWCAIVSRIVTRHLSR